VGIDAWIIQDGNYPDFERGLTEFALEFAFVEGVARTSETATSMAHIDGARHAVTGRVVATFRDAWVIDVGVLAFEERPPPTWAQPGVGCAGEIYLGVDPFFYFERLRLRPEFPALMYAWRIDDIALETTPWRTRQIEGRTIRSREETQPSYRSVDRTDAWTDDGGNAHYVLEARMVGGPTRDFVHRRWH
jgi:hypothetical protein